MAYEKQIWTTGDVITANKVNHIEDGIANGGGDSAFIVNLNNETLTLDKTWNEIKTAFTNKQPCYVALVINGADIQTMYPILACGLNGSTYMVMFLFSQDTSATTMVCTTTEPDGYPRANNGPTPN